MAKNYEYEYTHIELKHGYATFLGKDFKPSDELLNALNKMAELAYNECGRVKVNTGGRQLTIPDVSVSLLERAMLTLDDYLNAGSKETRKKAAENAKFIYKEYYGVDYINRNER